MALQFGALPADSQCGERDGCRVDLHAAAGTGAAASGGGGAGVAASHDITQAGNEAIQGRNDPIDGLGRRELSDGTVDAEHRH